MKKAILMLASLALVAALVGCGSKTDLAMGKDLMDGGNCAEAMPYFDATIAAPQQLMDMAYAYVYKGVCAEKAGRFTEAYENIYAGKVVTKYALAHATETNLNSYARSEFAERIIPEKLAELQPKAGNAASIRKKVDVKLHEKYLEQFVSE